MQVVLTNDDGINAVGLRALYHALVERGHSVSVIAPMAQQSAVGRAITIHTPLQIANVVEPGFQGIGVFGTPADCIKLGINELVSEKPDVVLSGINSGANIGSDIIYSGTVAAASEAACKGIRAMAISYAAFSGKKIDDHARYAVTLMEEIPWGDIPTKRVMNLNFPDLPLDACKGLKVCSLSETTWKDWYLRREDPFGRPYWWLDGDMHHEHEEQETDRHFISQGWVTLTPISFDFTDQKTLSALQKNMDKYP